jgi:hypothetical protein
MATTTRIYKVSPSADGGKARLVRASHPSHALRHVAADAFTVKVASQDDLVLAFERGIKVESIEAEQQSPA